MKTRLNAFIFDLDGVIIDSERTKFIRLGGLLKKRGIFLSKSYFKKLVGRKTSTFLYKNFKSKLSREQIETILKARREDQLKHIRLYAKIIPGVKRFIRLLKKRNFKLGLATGTKHKIVDKVLKLHGLGNYFQVLVTGEDFKSSKPDPGVYIIALKRLKLPKNKVAVIEDSVAGVIAAKKAGLFCIAITTTQTRNQLRCADLVVDSFEDLRKTFELLLL